MTRYFTASARKGDRVYEATGATIPDATGALHLGMVAKAGADSSDIRRAVAAASVREYRIGDCREWEATERPRA